MNQITIRKPDDFHAHLRDGRMLEKVLTYSNIFGKVLAMGNLTPPITTGEEATDYWSRIIQLGANFRPIMTIMLVNKTTPKIIREAYETGVMVIKLIPGGTSTGARDGVPLKSLKDYYPMLETAEHFGMIFSGHWELLADPETGESIPEEQRETRAIPFLIDVITTFPKLKIVVEHISTAAMVDVVEKAPDNVAATITGHHLGPFHLGHVIKDEKIVNPFLYCKPILKTIVDIKAVRKAATSGNQKFFFGSDSAPHPPEKKLGPSPAAGIFSAPTVIPHVFSVFYQEGQESRFEDFTSRFGAEFYDWPINKNQITLQKESWTVPKDYNGIVPFLAGEEIAWKII